VQRDGHAGIRTYQTRACAGFLAALCMVPNDVRPRVAQGGCLLRRDRGRKVIGGPDDWLVRTRTRTDNVANGRKKWQPAASPSLRRIWYRRCSSKRCPRVAGHDGQTPDTSLCADNAAPRRRNTYAGRDRGAVFERAGRRHFTVGAPAG
jgi:hypothetical protein